MTLAPAVVGRETPGELGTSPKKRTTIRYSLAREPGGTQKSYERMRFILTVALTALMPLGLGGCRAALYNAFESVGIHKRDLLVHRVADARDAQEAAREQFAGALARFRSVVQVDGGELEPLYDRLNAEYERSTARAGAVSDRIDAVEQVAEDLFEEWQDELARYSDPSLRADSKRLLDDTRRRYAALLKTMRRAESSMQPVLAAFQDQVLMLKHNLNAQAIGSLRKELASIEGQTAALLQQMERSIAEANRFIDRMKQTQAG